MVRVSPADIGIVARTWDISQVAAKMFQKTVKKGHFCNNFPQILVQMKVSFHFMVQLFFSFFQMIGKPHLYQNFVHKVDRYDQHVPVT